MKTTLPLVFLEREISYLIVDLVGQLHIHGPTISCLNPGGKFHDSFAVGALGQHAVVLGHDTVANPTIAAAKWKKNIIEPKCLHLYAYIVLLKDEKACTM